MSRPASPSCSRRFAKTPAAVWKGCDALGLKPSARLLLLALWQRQACGGTCRVDLPAISKDTGLAKGTIVAQTATLEAAGLLEVTRGRRSGQRQAVNEYDTLPFWSRVAEVTDRDDRANRQPAPTPAPSAVKGVQPVEEAPSDDVAAEPTSVFTSIMSTFTSAATPQSPIRALSHVVSGSDSGGSQSPIRCLEVEGVEGEETSTPREGPPTEGRDCARPPEYAPRERDATTRERRTAKPRIEGQHQADPYTVEQVQAMTDGAVRRHAGPTARNMPVERLRELLMAAARTENDERAPRAMA